MAALHTKHDQEMVNFCTLFGSAILTKSLEIFHSEQKKYIAELRSDSQREIVSFIYLSHSDLSTGILIERAIRFITP